LSGGFRDAHHEREESEAVPHPAQCILPR
jgi:hypothetical protein